ncbi:putative ribonuclease H-like domain-containing protein, partial [Tanacetum coccineum]
TIEEEVYVHQPLGFIDPAHPNKFYKVIKALYGLHQALRAWYETLSSFLLENGLRRGTKDEDGVEVDVHEYQSMIGSLMYLTASRPSMHVQVLTGNQQLVDVNFLVEDSYLGSARSRQLWQILLLRQNMLDCYEKRLIDVLKIHTDSNVTDLLTKGFDVTRISMVLRMDRSSPRKYNPSMV